MDASGSNRHVGDTKGMRTTDFTDDTDEEQREIQAGGSFRHSVIPPRGRTQSSGADAKPWGGCKAIFISFFISEIGAAFVRGLSPLIRGRSPPFLISAERSEAALGPFSPPARIAVLQIRGNVDTKRRPESLIGHHRGTGNAVS